MLFHRTHRQHVQTCRSRCKSSMPCPQGEGAPSASSHHCREGGLPGALAPFHKPAILWMSAACAIHVRATNTASAPG